jgi:hypothetical protein
LFRRAAKVLTTVSLPATEEEFKRGAVLHPNTVQMVELMCLLKPGILGELFGNTNSDRFDPTFGMEREGSFRNWHRKSRQIVFT